MGRQWRPGIGLVVLLTVALAATAGIPAARDAAGASSVPAATFQPFVDIIPDESGNELVINARSAAVGGTVYTNLLYQVGPTSHKGGYTMNFDTADQLYVTIVGGIASTSYLTGTLNLTSTLGLATPLVEFQRDYVLASSPAGVEEIITADGLFRLRFLNPGALAASTYVVTAAGTTPPGPAPAGQHLIGNIYTARAPATITQANEPVLLSLCYDPLQLGSRNPAALQIAQWSPGAQQWSLLGGTLSAREPCLSLAVQLFTSYVLMTPEGLPRRMHLPVAYRPD